MSASIWTPDTGTLTINSESSNLSQVFVASENQTLFLITVFEYVLDSDSVAVYRNGQRLIKDSDWEETTSTSITLLTSVAAGELIEVVAVLGASAANSILAQESADAAAASAVLAANAAASITVPAGKAVVLQDEAKIGAATLPSGTTAQRPVSPVFGDTRANTTLNSTEWWNGTAWVPMGGGATGAAGNYVFIENDMHVTGNYEITANKNAMSAGPITVDNGVTVTIPNNSVWSIV